MQSDPRALGVLADEIRRLSTQIDKIDHAQDALLANGLSLQEQIQAEAKLIGRLIELVTPERCEQEEPTLVDLFARLIQQQAASLELMRQTLQIVTRLEQRSV